MSNKSSKSDYIRNARKAKKQEEKFLAEMEKAQPRDERNKNVARKNKKRFGDDDDE